MSVATISFDPDNNNYRIRFSYAPEFIEFLKFSIPRQLRGFDPGTRTWWFSPEFLHAVVSEAHQVFECVSAPGQAEPESEKAIVSLDSLKIAFFDTLPPAALKSAYRTAATTLHPDKDGSSEEMLKLNLLWEQIEREFISKARNL